MLFSPATSSPSLTPTTPITLLPSSTPTTSAPSTATPTTLSPTTKLPTNAPTVSWPITLWSSSVAQNSNYVNSAVAAGYTVACNVPTHIDYISINFNLVSGQLIYARIYNNVGTLMASSVAGVTGSGFISCAVSFNFAAGSTYFVGFWIPVAGGGSGYNYANTPSYPYSVQNFQVLSSSSASSDVFPTTANPSYGYWIQLGQVVTLSPSTISQTVSPVTALPSST